MFIFVVLLGWLIIQLCGLMAWSFWTYPTIDDAKSLFTAGGPDMSTIFLDLQKQWLASVLGLGTSLAITPVFALLGTVVGFILKGQTADAKAQTVPPEKTELTGG